MTIAPGSISISLDLTCVDDDGLEVVGGVASTLPPLYYSVGNNTAGTQVTPLSDLALITTVYTARGVKERAGSAGVYRVDVPDAAFASAARVTFFGWVSGKRWIPVEVDVQNAPANVLAFSGIANGAVGGLVSPILATCRMASATLAGATSLPTTVVTGGNIPAGSTILFTGTFGANAAFGQAYYCTGGSGGLYGIAPALEYDVAINDPFIVLTYGQIPQSQSGARGTVKAVTTSDDEIATADAVALIPTTKTGYALTAAYDPAKTAAQAGDAMALTSGERTTLVGVMWSYLLTSITTVGSIGKWLKDQLNFTYTAPDNAGINTKLDAVAADTAAMKGTGWLSTDNLHTIHAGQSGGTALSDEQEAQLLGAYTNTGLLALGVRQIVTYTQTSSIGIIQGDSYLNADSRPIIVYKAANAPWPTDLTGWTITAEITPTAGTLANAPTAAPLSITGTVVTATGSNQAVRWDMTAVQTAALVVGSNGGASAYRYDVRASSGTKRVTLEIGYLNVTEDAVD